MVKAEYAPFQQFGLADPENKVYSLFHTLVAGYGITPWLSGYVFVPYKVKSQAGVGTDLGFGDPGLYVNFGFKYDDGFRLVPQKESLDELMDWHFSVFGFATLPMGPTTAATPALEWYAPDMQTGFGSPSFQIGIAAEKQISADFTWLGDASYQYFFRHTYPFTRYQFGAESRLDLAGEVNLLNLQRDRESNSAGAMEALQASGGTILYAGLGVQAYFGRFSAALAARTSFARWLNEGSDQQGSEGLEWVRVALTLSYVLPL